MILATLLTLQKKFMVNLSNLKTLTVQRDMDTYKQICGNYVGRGLRHESNYSLETVEQLIKDNYFNIGAYTILANDEYIAGFGLYHHEDYVFMARLVTVAPTDIPLFGVMIDEARNHMRKGIVMTFNESNLSIRKIINQRINYTGTNVHILYSRLRLRQFVWHPTPINYRYTKQWMFYYTPDNHVPKLS